MLLLDRIKKYSFQRDYFHPSTNPVLIAYKKPRNTLKRALLTLAIFAAILVAGGFYYA